MYILYRLLFVNPLGSKQSLTCSLYLKAEKSPGQTVKAHASFALPERSQTGVLLVPSKGKPSEPSFILSPSTNTGAC